MGDITSHGMTFKKGDGNTPTEAFTKVGPVYDINFSGLTRAAVDTTDHDSTDHYGEYLGGRREGGQVTVQYVVTGADDPIIPTLLAEINDGDNHNYQVVWRDAVATFEFNGLAISYQPVTPMDDKLVFTMAYQVSGKPTLTQA